METPTRAPIRFGPFVTQAGRRLPILKLTARDVPALVEFFDHRARRGLDLALSGNPSGTREGLAAMDEAALRGGLLGVRASQVGPLRGVAESTAAADGTRAPSILLDESIETAALRAELVHRLDELADSANAAA
jgi:hypothetical protein